MHHESSLLLIGSRFLQSVQLIKQAVAPNFRMIDLTCMCDQIDIQNKYPEEQNMWLVG